MPIFVFQFKIKPERHYHLTVKHGHAAVYAKANGLKEADVLAQKYVASKHWTISSVEVSGFEYNPVLHGLPDEALELCRLAEQKGVSMGVCAVGFAPDGSGPKS